jgi:hypothetical protein
MKKVAILSRDRNRSIERDLLPWRQSPPRNASRATLQIAKRFGLSLDHAGTIARLAGIGGLHHES